MPATKNYSKPGGEELHIGGKLIIDESGELINNGSGGDGSSFFIVKYVGAMEEGTLVISLDESMDRNDIIAAAKATEPMLALLGGPDGSLQSFYLASVKDNEEYGMLTIAFNAMVVFKEGNTEQVVCITLEHIFAIEYPEDDQVVYKVVTMQGGN